MSEMLIALIVIAVLFGGGVAGVIYISRVANQREQEDEQGTKKFVEAYGLLRRTDHSLLGTVEGVPVEFSHDTIPGKPADHGEQIDKRENKKPTLRVTGECKDGRSWLLCPIEDMEYLRGKFSIPDSWARVATGNAVFDGQYALVADGGLMPPFARDGQILQSLIDWGLWLALADGQRIVAHTQSRSVGLVWLGSADHLERALRVILPMCRVGEGSQ